MLELYMDKQRNFSEFYGQYYDRTVSYIEKRLRNIQEAEDLAEDVFLYCFAHYEEYDPEKSSRLTWLYVIINSRLKNAYRDRKYYVDLESVAGVLSDTSVDMDMCLYLEQVGHAVRKILEKLPSRQRKVIELRYFEERSSEEAAEIMQTTPGNIRVMLNRALKKFGQEYEKQMEDMSNG